MYCTCWVCHESCMCIVLSLSTPHFSNTYIWNTIWNSLNFELSYLKWKGVDSDRHFACYWYIWNSTEQNSHFIKLWYLKWKGVDRDRTLHILGLNWIANMNWHSPLISQLVSTCALIGLVNLWQMNLKNGDTHIDRQTDRQSDMIDCWTAYFHSKKIIIKMTMELIDFSYIIAI